MVNLSGKVALVTGSASGIGQATAIHFAELGCQVALTDINTEGVLVTKRKINEINGKAIVLPGDLTDPKKSEEIVSKTVKHFGKLDILVNCAGIIFFAPAENVSEELIDKIFAVNYRAVFRLIQKSLPHLKQTKGNVVTVSSMASTRPIKDVSQYCSSKAAIDSLTKTLALEFGEYGIRVNSVNPGCVRTNIFVSGGLTPTESDGLWDTFEEMHLLKRCARLEEITKPIAFLASDDASFVTGTNFLVDGGYSLKN